MKGYRIRHLETNGCEGGRPDFIEQCNFHFDNEITFYGWSYCQKGSRPCNSTVAIFKIKWK